MIDAEKQHLSRDKGSEILELEDANQYLCTSPEDFQLIINRLLQCEIEEEKTSILTP